MAINTWLNDLVKNANERLFNDAELERMIAHGDTVNNRLKGIEELERLEIELQKTLPEELKQRYPDRPLYSRRLVLDVLESLRHVGLAMLFDEPRLLHERWIAPMLQVVDLMDIQPGHVLDIYRAIQEKLDKKLTKTSRELIQPYLTANLEALAPPTLMPA
jgi:hypothetical protein